MAKSKLQATDNGSLEVVDIHDEVVDLSQGKGLPTADDNIKIVHLDERDYQELDGIISKTYQRKIKVRDVAQNLKATVKCYSTTGLFKITTEIPYSLISDDDRINNDVYALQAALCRLCTNFGRAWKEKYDSARAPVEEKQESNPKQKKMFQQEDGKKEAAELE